MSASTLLVSTQGVPLSTPKITLASLSTLLATPELNDATIPSQSFITSCSTRHPKWKSVFQWFGRRPFDELDNDWQALFPPGIIDVRYQAWARGTPRGNLPTTEERIPWTLARDTILFLNYLFVMLGEHTRNAVFQPRAPSTGLGTI